ncbi:malto-oligosyltrehalose trehalohydrolase [Schumannella sp. 10F1B-5-1]|uniref:malto-oligosyltrehalose trehalohydrolase n=1 Tax=Schumannella sp. 10F1B-5-1 TaxID=2590780 RepID=UPI001131D6A8|nr:malto-oligosyltrehalose trehalohydrolase [Schumannella sp. 10F1B-5-1]TPW76954.1 malto-oligosyltrehalose trehalohydrolase [Schumannella sp. 10F1B-5-1]
MPEIDGESGTIDGFRPRVWAPIPERVRLHLDGADAGDLEREGPSSEGDGWWAWTGAPLPVGARYGFLLDDDTTPLPDPRGRRLPDGVHGTSEVVDAHPLAGAAGGSPAGAGPDGHPWHGRALAGGVIYELHIGTYTPEGTLDAAIERLDHLVELGIDFVELLPVNGVNGTHNWGYDGVAWYTVHEAIGGPEGYRRFVAAAHERGLAVIQDVVYNHLGPSGNYLPRFGPYLRTGSRNTWGDSVNLDEQAVRDYILDNVRLWIAEYGVDGLRLDAVHALLDEREPHILAEIGAIGDELSASLGRPITLIAESDLNDPVMFTARDAGSSDSASGDASAGGASAGGETGTAAPSGYGLTAQWSDDYHHAVHVALTGETDGYYADFAPLGALAKAASRGFFHDGTFSSFRDREHGKPIPSDAPTSALVTFAQDHDQIGNRAAGDRLTASLTPRRLAVAAVLNLLSPFTPMLFMGEEWGATTPWQFFTSHPEPELGRATAEGRIAEFERMGWDPDVVPDPQDPATFANSKLDWSERDAPQHRDLLELHRELIRLRHELPEFGSTTFDELSATVDEQARTLAVRIRGLVVAVNLGLGDYSLPADELLFRTSDDVVSPAEGVITLPPDSAALLCLTL